MQWVIIGAGNMGCVYGGNLARIGQQVAVIDVWQEHIDRINESGLHSEGLTGNFTVQVPAFTDARQAPRADAVLVSVNAYSTSQAAETAKHLLKAWLASDEARHITGQTISIDGAQSIYHPLTRNG